MRILSTQLDTGRIIRRSLFLVVLLIMTLGNLFVLFQGLDSPQAMDQAQISREIARGNGCSTKFIRPVAYYQAQNALNAQNPQRTSNRTVSLMDFQDTYHSPLNLLINAAVFKLVGADQPDSWPMEENEMIFPLDRVIAAVSALFFLMAIWVNYLLISRIFDAKIAAVCAILMLFCETFWNYALSGLPQMQMLFFFSCGIYFVYRAVEASTESRIALVPAILAGVFFSLLALTHWMAVWIALGYIIFAAIVFRPRGVVAISILALVMIAAVGPILRNYRITDTPFGTAFLTLYNGLGNGSETAVMRTIDLDAEPLVLDGLISKILRTTLLQFTDIIPLLGGIVIAPLFFISLLHPFKRTSIANFRWAILLMWGCAAFGLAFFGISRDPLDPNQIHLLFAPIMTAYALAFISLLWSRLEFVAMTPSIRNFHHIVIVAVCSLPFVLKLPDKVHLGMQLIDRGGVPHWPPYYAPAMNNKKTGLQAWTTEQQVIFSDQPWAVAWYADRVSIWLPPTHEGFERLETIAQNLKTPVAGILISPSSHSASLSEISSQYKDFTFLVLDGRTFFMNYPSGVSLFDKEPKTLAIAKRYPYRQALVGKEMVYYGDRPTNSGK